MCGPSIDRMAWQRTPLRVAIAGRQDVHRAMPRTDSHTTYTGDCHIVYRDFRDLYHLKVEWLGARLRGLCSPIRVCTKPQKLPHSCDAHRAKRMELRAVSGRIRHHPVPTVEKAIGDRSVSCRKRMPRLRCGPKPQRGHSCAKEMMHVFDPGCSTGSTILHPSPAPFGVAHQLDAAISVSPHP